MDEPAIKLPDDYKSGFLIRVKKTNGKVASVWYEITSHHASLETTLQDFDNLIKDLNLQSEIQMNGRHETQIIKQAKRFVCAGCGYEVPVLNPEQPDVMRLPCPSCNRWQNFQKR